MQLPTSESPSQGKCKFSGHLNIQSSSTFRFQTISSGLRRLNRGNCYTPKFSRIFFQKKKEEGNRLLSKNWEFHIILDFYSINILIYEYLVFRIFLIRYFGSLLNLFLHKC